MKKSLLFLSAVALMASCTNDLMEESAPAVANGGVTFEIENAETRGMVDGLSSFFFAEQDRINIWVDNASVNGAASTAYGKMATYKATSSQGNPKMTAIDDGNMITLKPISTDPKVDYTGKFFVAYPLGQTMAYDADKKTFTVTPVKDLTQQSMKSESYNNFDSRLLYQYVEGKKENFYESAGEKINLNLTSPLAMVRMSMQDIETYSKQFGNLKSVSLSGVNNAAALTYALTSTTCTVSADDVTTIGGKSYLKTTVNNKGAKVDAAKDLVTIDGNKYYKSTCAKISDDVWALTNKSVKYGSEEYSQYATGDPFYALYGDSDPSHDKEAKAGDVIPGNGTKSDAFVVGKDNKMTFTPGDITGIMNKVELSDIPASYVKNNAQMDIFVMPAAKRATDGDTYDVTYKFEKVWLSYRYTTKNAWEANKAYNMSLNIAEKFNYIVTMGTDGAKRDLIINSGNVKQILNNDDVAKATKVKWTDAYATKGEVDFADIETIQINAGVDALTDDDWAALKKLNKATELTIKNNTPVIADLSTMASLKKLTVDNATEVKKDALKGIAANITDLNLPKVTKYPNDGNAFAILKNLTLSAITFEGTESGEAAPIFFNDNTKKTLENVDIKSVTSLAPVFGWERNILFQGYTKLETIKLNANETKISANEFQGCTALKTVEGVVNMGTATAAFKDCGKLATVKISGTVIPAEAFKNSAVKNVLNGDKQVVPTNIGEDAFYGNKAIELMDLTNVEGTKLGQRAFYNATAFYGNNKAGQNNVVTLKVTEVKQYTFFGTQVVRFQLINATKTAPYSLASKPLKQIKYRKAGLKAADIDASQVNDKAVVDIFVADAEDAAVFGGYRTVTEENFDWAF